MEMFVLLVVGLGALVSVQRLNDDIERMQRIRVRDDEQRDA